MKKIIDKIGDFIDLKTVLTLSMTGVFLYLAVTKVIPVESFMVIFGMVIGWYFTKPKDPAANTTTTTETTTSATTTKPEVK